MKKSNLEKFIKGWFIGDFEPSLLKTKDFEIAIKNYKTDDYEPAHYHKIAIEYTVIIDGEVLMNGTKYSTGDIIIIEPGDITDFKSLTNSSTLVIKQPSIKDDKYIIK